MALKGTGIYGEFYYTSLALSSPLSDEEMAVNANYIKNTLTDKGWSINAICAILGNMQAESTINPSRWQNDTYNLNGGYGLVQWTPATKFISWANANGYSNYHTIDANLARIAYEIENAEQWIATDTYSLSFEEFTKSTKSIAYLAKAFLLCYERPADQSESVQTYRASLAEAWAGKLGAEIVVPSNPLTPGKKKFNFLLFNARRRREQWIK